MICAIQNSLDCCSLSSFHLRPVMLWTSKKLRWSAACTTVLQWPFLFGGVFNLLCWECTLLVLVSQAELPSSVPCLFIVWLTAQWRLRHLSAESEGRALGQGQAVQFTRRTYGGLKSRFTLAFKVVKFLSHSLRSLRSERSNRRNKRHYYCSI